MTQINNYNNYNPQFYGKVQKEQNVSENDNKLQKLITKCTEVLNDYAQRQVPENNQFKKVFVAFDVPQSKNEGFITISHDEQEPKDKRRVAVEVHHPNSDKFYSHYIFKGTKKEVLDYIKNPENTQRIMDSVLELSKSVDEDSGYFYQ